MTRLARRFCAAWLAGFLALGAPAAIAAETAFHACPDPSFAVQADTPALHDRICRIAGPIRDDLGACGLGQTRPLQLQIVPRLTEPYDTCLAHFDCGDDVIRIVDPVNYPDLVVKDEIYAQLPEDDLLKALLTHEMAHALSYQTAAGVDVGILDQEFIAAAMELELMPRKWRDMVIEDASVPLPPDPGRINMFIYMAAPRKFAVSAWRHFGLPGNGCGLVGKILSGEASVAR